MARSAKEMEQAAIQAFRGARGANPSVVARAPARVELLGNHTDYNGGLVLAAAIDRFTAVAGKPIAKRQGRVHSSGFGEETFPVDALEKGAEGSWGRYVRGVLWALGQSYEIRHGFDAAIVGDVPQGAGISSSASLQACFASFLISAGVVDDPVTADRPLITAAHADERRLTLAQILQRSENDFVGVASGLLDQFTVLFGRAGHVLTLDCRTLAYERLPLGNPAPAIIVCDSKTTRKLADGMYNRRRAECETIVSFFRERRGQESVRSLRDITLNELEGVWDQLDPVGRLRAKHVLNENLRVENGALALKAGDLVSFGRLMSASHESSRDDFANSSSALDTLIQSAEESPGFLGGKLSGAGWAGCTVNLVKADQAEAFAEAVSARFAHKTAVVPDVHVCRAADGARGTVLSSGA